MVRMRNLVKVGNREVKKRYIGNKLIFEDLGDKTEVLSGEEIYTDKSDDSVVHVEVDGKSYQDGVPTPDYPIEIHSVNDFDVVSSVSGRNLIISSDVTPDFYITSNDTHAATEGHFITGFIEVKANEFYTISMLLQRNGYSRVAYYDLDKNFIKRDLFINQEITRIKPEQDGFIRWSPDVDSKTGGYGYGYKIEKGNIATDWTPAPEDITENDNHSLIDKINLSLSEPLRSVGDVKDRLFIDSDGLWKIERNVGERILNGEENWTAQGDGSYYTGFPNKKISINTNLQSNRFIAVIGSSQTLDTGRMRNTTSNRNLVFYFDEGVGGAANFKSWLSSNNTKVYYELADPIIEILNQEFQDKLNNLRSFQDSNYVYTVSDKTDILPDYVADNLKPTLHAKFKSKGWYDYYQKTLLK